MPIAPWGMRYACSGDMARAPCRMPPGVVQICPLRGAGQSAPAEKLTPMVLKKSFFTRGRLACGDVPKFWCVRVAHPISWLEQTG
ncbi:unnamed protein product [Prorocentrum cordatum]|uniref:Uncharacterized protein n=1 Tax=Prorocentrum cordatum TaxID=2364126 RepID=A0ABN9WY86_9DINO|nr:unnamed protein product [Polarella glacialis]